MNDSEIQQATSMDIHRHIHANSDNLAVQKNYSNLDEIDVSDVAGDLVVYTPTAGQMETFFELSLEAMGTTASLNVIKEIASRNPDTVHAFGARGRHTIDNPHADGFLCWLPLTREGHACLRNFTFDPAAPAPEHLADQHEKPDAIYIWGIFGAGRGTSGLAWAFQRWSTPHLRDSDIYVRAATPSGLRLYQRVGFEPVFPTAAEPERSLVVFRRDRATLRPLYDTYPSDTTKYTATVVRSANDLAKVMAIRSAAFLGEQACPYDEEFDGNDFSSTHLLGFVNNEPAASIRVRWFADFAKAERLAVRAEFRRSRLAFVLVKAAHELCRVKGYRRIYGHAQKDLVDFWSRAGGRPFPGAREFTFSDHQYVEMLSEVPPHPEAIGIGADPYLIIRPEGRWHTACTLERSASRPVATHSADPVMRRQRRA